MGMTVRHCAVLGSPVDHSLSPVIHRAAYEAMGLDGWDYTRKEVSGRGLAPFVRGLDHSWAGLSLTMPLKKEVMHLGRAGDIWSRRLGVANTAVFNWQAGTGRPAVCLYNTDVEGIVCALCEAGGDLVHPDGASSLIGRVGRSEQVTPSSDLSGAVIGTGSTAESAVCALALLGVGRLTVVARHVDHAARIKDMAGRAGFALVQVMDIKAGDAVARMLAGVDMTISTLPPGAADGLAGHLCGNASTGGLGRSHDPALLDVAYGPHPSELVKAWRRVTGGRAVGGERMLLYQAIRQVSLMTGRPLGDIPVQAMDQAVKEALDEA